MREKLSLEKFLEIKEKLLTIIEKMYEEYNEIESNFPDATYREIYKNTTSYPEYRGLLEQLTTYDLSDIPAESWEGIEIFNDGLNFEGTYANIDFKYLDVDKAISFKTCNIKNLEASRFYLSKENFDNEVVIENKKCFLNDDYSEDFKQKYYTGELELSDYYKLTPKQKQNLSKKELLNRTDIYILDCFIKDVYDKTDEEKERLYTILIEKLEPIFDRIKKIRGYEYYFSRLKVELNEEEIISFSSNEILKKLYSRLRNYIESDIRNRYEDFEAWRKLPEDFVSQNRDLFLLDLDKRIRENIITDNISVDYYIDNIESFIKMGYTPEQLFLLYQKFLEEFEAYESADKFYKKIIKENSFLIKYICNKNVDPSEFFNLNYHKKFELDDNRYCDYFSSEERKEIIYKYLKEKYNDKSLYEIINLIDINDNQDDILNTIIKSYLSWLKIDESAIKKAKPTMEIITDFANYANFIKLLKNNNSPEIDKENIDFYSIIKSKEDLYIKLKISKYFSRIKYERSELRNEFLKYCENNLSDLTDEKIIKKIEFITKISKYFSKIKNKSSKISKIQEEFLRYCENNLSDLSEDKLNYLVEVITRLMYSNSGKLSRLCEEITPLVLNSKNPIESLNNIENIYLTNHLPDAAKAYLVFRELHTNADGTLKLNLSESIGSPVLNKYNREMKINNETFNVDEMIISTDVIKAAIYSNNINLRNYIHILKNSERLINNLENYEFFTDEEKRELKNYTQMLCGLYNRSLNGKKSLYKLTNNTLLDLNFLINGLKANKNINDRIVRMFTGFAGINTLDELIAIMDNCAIEKDKRNKKILTDGFKLEKGDLIKGLNEPRYLSTTLFNGILATEFLGSGASKEGDCTPLDTDFSYILEDSNSLTEGINGTITKSYGYPIIVIKNDNPTIYISRNNDSKKDRKYIKDKVEVFNTLGKGHYGIRTGCGSGIIDYIIVDKYYPEYGQYVAMTGLYTPIVNLNGEVLFTEEDYSRIRSQMEGLSHYNCETYTISNKLITPEIDSIANTLTDNETITKEKGNLVKEVLKNALENLEIDGQRLGTKFCMDGNLEPRVIEILDTGSTGRGTNVPNDSDFDFIVRIDNDIIKDVDKENKIRNAIAKALNQSDTDVLKYENVTIPGIEEKVQIDITLERKTDDINYTTDECIRDRLNTIKKSHPESYDYVIANILYAKKVLKKYKCYLKHGHKGCINGGLGGVGVENWILQHHGSFVEAAEDFLDKAKNCNTFDEFKKAYRVFDFGENFLYKKNSTRSTLDRKYDEFVYDNMDAEGFKAMKEGLQEALNKIKNGENVLEEEIIDNSKTR